MSQGKAGGAAGRVVLVIMTLPAGLFSLFLAGVLATLAFDLLPEKPQGLLLIGGGALFLLLAVLMFSASIRALRTPDPKLGLFSPPMLKVAGITCVVLGAITPVLAGLARADFVDALYPGVFFVSLGLAALRLARKRQRP